MRRIVAIGGGGFLMERGRSPLDEYVVSLIDVARPRICFLNTGGGDPEEGLAKYYSAFRRFNARLSHLAFFRKPRTGSIPLLDVEPYLLEQDLIYVGGGNTRAMLSVWREWSLPRILRIAHRQGTLLAGMSAGALCWFDWAASDYAWTGRSNPLRCLGLLKGSCSTHWHRERHRRADYLRLVKRGLLPSGYGIDDGAAVMFENGRFVEVVSSQSGVSASYVERVGSRAKETRLKARLL